MKKTDLQIGSLIAFQIDQIEGFTAPNKGKWGVIKILHLGKINDNSFSFSVKEGLWDSCPKAWKVRFKPTLIEKRFEKKAKLKPSIFTTPFDCKINLKSVTIIGREFFNNKFEREALQKINESGSSWRVANLSSAEIALDHENRAKTDAVLWKKEIQASHDRRMAKHLDRQKREKERLKGISLNILADEIQFPSWDNRTQIVPKQFTSEVRKKASELIITMQSLGDRPKRADIRKNLKVFIIWLNSIDGKYKYQIETEEREDLMGFVEEICWATKQKPLIEESDSWRKW